MEALICAISIIQPYWITEARDEWKKNEEVWTLIQKLQTDPSTSNTFCWKMIPYGTNIAYIFVIIPKSNKILFWNCTPLPQDVTRDF